jgi:Amt family ammonium transporter
MGDQIDCIGNGTYSTGDTAWVLASAFLVFLQTPALAIMQAGMIRRSGFLSMFLQVLAGLSIGGVLWLIYGFSLTYGKDHAHVIGDLNYAMYINVDPAKCFANAPTIGTAAYIMYELTFAIMTPVLCTGTWAERIHFPALAVFCVLWPLLVWYPLAHWVWGGGWLAVLGMFSPLFATISFWSLIFHSDHV